MTSVSSVCPKLNVFCLHSKLILVEESHSVACGPPEVLGDWGNGCSQFCWPFVAGTIHSCGYVLQMDCLSSPGGELPRSRTLERVHQHCTDRVELTIAFYLGDTWGLPSSAADCQWVWCICYLGLSYIPERRPVPGNWDQSLLAPDSV